MTRDTHFSQRAFYPLPFEKGTLARCAQGSYGTLCGKGGHDNRFRLITNNILKMLKCMLMKSSGPLKCSWRQLNFTLWNERRRRCWFPNRRKRNALRIHIGHVGHHFQPVIRYLMMRINAKINFRGNLDHACEKAAHTSVSLEGIMPYIVGLWYSRIWLVAGMVLSALLYVASVWWKVLASKHDLPLSGVKGVQCL